MHTEITQCFKIACRDESVYSVLFSLQVEPAALIKRLVSSQVFAILDICCLVIIFEICNHYWAMCFADYYIIARSLVEWFQLFGIAFECRRAETWRLSRRKRRCIFHDRNGVMLLRFGRCRSRLAEQLMPALLPQRQPTGVRIRRHHLRQRLRTPAPQLRQRYVAPPSPASLSTVSYKSITVSTHRLVIRRLI